MSILTAYLDFITRPLPAPRARPLLEQYPSMWNSFFAMTAFFIIMNRAIPFVCAHLWPHWWKSLTPTKQFDLPGYATSIVHHCLCITIGWIWIVDDFNGLVDFANPTGIYRTFEAVIVPWVSAYFIADIICCAIPELVKKGKFEFLLHHTLGLWLTYAVAATDANFTRFFAHLLICETTGVFFGIAWILRAAGYSNSIIVKTLEILFALGFIVLRGGNLTVVVVYIFLHPQSTTGLGLGRFTLPLIGLMQWVWLYKIVTGLTSRFGAKPIKTDSGVDKKHD
jgi:hypothetical protein